MSGVAIDRLMAGAWPPAEVARHGDWLFRSTLSSTGHAVTRRANSVFVDGQPDGDQQLAAAIDAAEQFYADRASPAVFQLSDASAGADVSGALRDRGYLASATTVMIEAATEKLRTGAVADAASEGWRIEVAEQPSDEWFDTYWEVEQGRRTAPEEAATLRSVLLQPTSPARFVAARIDDDAEGRIAAAGQVVVADGWGCCQCLVTAPWARRRGAASIVMRQLAAESWGLGAHRLFAAVMADNTASLALCEGLGFSKSHTYSYLARAAA